MAAGHPDRTVERAREVVRGRQRAALRQLFVLATAVGPSPGRQHFEQIIRQARAALARRATRRGTRPRGKASSQPEDW